MKTTKIDSNKSNKLFLFRAFLNKKNKIMSSKVAK